MGTQSLSKYPNLIKQGPFGKFILHNKYEKQIYSLFCSIGDIEARQGARMNANALRRHLQSSVSPHLLAYKDAYDHMDFYRHVEDFLVARGMECSNVCGHEHRLPRIAADIWAGEYFKIERNISIERFQKQRYAGYSSSETTAERSSASSVEITDCNVLLPASSNINTLLASSSDSSVCGETVRETVCVIAASPLLHTYSAKNEDAKVPVLISASRIVEQHRKSIYFLLKKKMLVFAKIPGKVVKRTWRTMKKRPPRKRQPQAT